MSYLKFYEKLGYIYFSEFQEFNNCSNFESRLISESSHILQLSSIALKECDWLTVFDVDEFMFPSQDIFKSTNYLKKIVKEIEPKYQLTYKFWHVSYSNDQHRSNYLLIDQFKDGHFPQPSERRVSTRDYNIGKHLSKSSIVDIWKFSHSPDLKPGYSYLVNNADFQPGYTHNCTVPTLPIILRHFVCASFDDTSKYRSSKRFVTIK